MEWIQCFCLGVWVVHAQDYVPSILPTVEAELSTPSDMEILMCPQISEISKKVQFVINELYPSFLSDLRKKVHTKYDSNSKNTPLSDSVLNYLHCISDDLEELNVCDSGTIQILYRIIMNLSNLMSDSSSTFTTVPISFKDIVHSEYEGYFIDNDENKIPSVNFNWLDHLKRMANLLDTNLSLFAYKDTSICPNYVAVINYKSTNEDLCSYYVKVNQIAGSEVFKFVESFKNLNQNWNAPNLVAKLTEWLFPPRVCTINGFTIEFDSRSECAVPKEFFIQSCAIEKVILNSIYQYLNKYSPEDMEHIETLLFQCPEVLIKRDHLYNCLDNINDYKQNISKYIEQSKFVTIDEMKKFLSDNDECNWDTMLRTKIFIFTAEIFMRCASDLYTKNKGFLTNLSLDCTTRSSDLSSLENIFS